jgi:hypothetical protein
MYMHHKGTKEERKEGQEGRMKERKYDTKQKRKVVKAGKERKWGGRGR